ncbi:hypothetical protein PGB90_009453 [Kerria lacca]
MIEAGKIKEARTLAQLQGGQGVSSMNATSEKGYATDEMIIGESLHEALSRFLLLFPEMQKNKIILSGESYAGKYLPSLAYTILRKNETNPVINVYGLFLGNPMMNPEYMLLHYNEYLYAHGLIDEQGKKKFYEREKQILIYIKSLQWDKAEYLFAKTFFEGLGNTLFIESSGLQNHFDISKNKFQMNKYHNKFLNETSTKIYLHVGERTYNRDNWKVENHLKVDFMKSVKPFLEEVLEYYRILIYSGQLDIICPYYTQEWVFRNLKWSGSLEYFYAVRKPFYWN